MTNSHWLNQQKRRFVVIKMKDFPRILSPQSLTNHDTCICNQDRRLVVLKLEGYNVDIHLVVLKLGGYNVDIYLVVLKLGGYNVDS